MLYEEAEPGTVIEHVQSRTIYASETALFSALTHHHNPLYLDGDRAKDAGYGDLVVNPFYVFNLVLGITVRELTENAGPFLGADQIEFIVSPPPGSSIRARSTVVSRRLSRSRPGWGIVTWETEGWAPEPIGTVIKYVRSNLVPTASNGGVAS